MRVIILGAGITGLSLAFFLRQRFGRELDVRVVEASGRAGGVIRSSDCQGYFFEEGPRGLRPTARLMQLIDDLRLREQVIFPSPSFKMRWIYDGHQLQKVPSGLREFFTSPLTKPLLVPFLKEWRVPKGAEDESVDAFFRRRLGAHAAEILGGCLVQGVFAGNPKLLSMKDCFPRLYALEQRFGSFSKALLFGRKKRRLPPLLSFQEGLETLVGKLAECLAPYLQLDTEVTGIHLENGRVAVTTTRGTLEGDRLFCCLPAYRAAQLIENREVASILSSIPFEGLTLVKIGYQTKPKAFQGFGYLIPPYLGKDVFGATFDSETFPQHSKGKEGRMTLLLRSSNETAVLEALKEHLLIDEAPDFLQSVTFKKAIPQYMVGHGYKCRRLEEIAPQIRFLGNSYRGIAVSDCIDSAFSAVETL